MSRFAVHNRPIGLGLMLCLISMGAAAALARAEQPTAGRWSVEVSTAPHLPQDAWFAGLGNNVDGWRGGGSLCINHLAQGFTDGEQVTLLVNVIEGGIFGEDKSMFGEDGRPVPAGTYRFPGIELPTIDYTVADHKTYYLILDVYVVQSKLPVFPVGTTLSFMYMWDHEPGRSIRPMVLWVDFGFGFMPFLNEGDMMANVEFHPEP